jgi:Domain of unknown function (DUF4185)
LKNENKHMSTRREFLKHSVATAACVSVANPVTRATETQHGPTPIIKSVVRRDESIIRYGGNGDVYPLTWGQDGRQFSAWLDGAGWADGGPLYNTRVFSVSGDPQHAHFEELSGYPQLYPLGRDPRYYGFGLLALEGRIYQFLNALESTKTEWRWTGTKIVYSGDSGRTWQNQDGSAIVWETYAAQSYKTLLFFKEPHSAFSLVSVLQMGREYGENRDGYVYLYSPNGFTDGLMNQLVLARVPTDKLLQRSAYEFFAGLRDGGAAKWSPDIEARAPVHTFPRGWVNTTSGPDTMVAQSWVPSVTYNAPLGIYMMANWGDGPAADGSWFGKPSYLGFWVAPNPWGPWRQIHEERAWTPASDSAARCYSPQIAPGWIAPDGKSFWLVWTDFKGVVEAGEELTREGITDETMTHKDEARVVRFMRERAPYYSFNAQRVDLVLA